LRGRRLAAASFGTAVLLSASIAGADVDACVAASQQSLTLRHQGKLHDALQQLATCSDPRCPDEVKAECTRRMEGVRGAMPTLVLAAKDGAGNDLYAVRVTMDGAPLLAALDGRALSIDPGEHSFTFETAGQPPLDKKLVLREGDKERQETVVLGPAPAVVPPASAPSPAPSSSWSTNKTMALASAGVGLVGVALGVVFGAYAKSSQNLETTNCSSATSCSNGPQSREDYTVATQDATASTVSFIAGAALVAVGTTLWFTAPSPARSPAAATAPSFRVAPTMMGTRGGGLVIGGDL
jgi:hypothetical protein